MALHKSGNSELRAVLDWGNGLEDVSCFHAVFWLSLTLHKADNFKVSCRNITSGEPFSPKCIFGVSLPLGEPHCHLSSALLGLMLSLTYAAPSIPRSTPNNSLGQEWWAQWCQDWTREVALPWSWWPSWPRGRLSGCSALQARLKEGREIWDSLLGSRSVLRLRGRV